jgi:hypothetical protein
MKLKLIRCGICDAWIFAEHNHCRVCGSTRAIRINNRNVYLNYARLTQGETLQIARSIPLDRALHHLSAQ